MSECLAGFARLPAKRGVAHVERRGSLFLTLRGLNCAFSCMTPGLVRGCQREPQRLLPIGNGPLNRGSACLTRLTPCEAELQFNDTLATLMDNVRHYTGVPAHWLAQDWQQLLPPILLLEYHASATRLRLSSMIPTFGAAEGVTTDELLIETFPPTDEDNAALLRGLAAS